VFVLCVWRETVVLLPALIRERIIISGEHSTNFTASAIRILMVLVMVMVRLMLLVVV
jgi:hypothetical protein